MAHAAGVPTEEALNAAGRETDLSQLFRDVTEDAWLRANTSAGSQAARVLPVLPDESVQRRFSGKAGDEALVEAHALARTFKDLYREHVGPLTESTRVLDYGCGWGRITRFFLKDVSGQNLWGIDCNEDLIDFCRESNPWCRFALNDPLPPTDLAADHFDLVFSYSVFTHLREDVHLAWLDELRRVVRSGGLLVLTVRPRHFIPYCAGLTAETATQNALVGLFPDPDQALGDYDRGRFVYVPYRVSGYGEWWGEACIPRAYVEREWATRGFEVLDFVEDPSRFKQNLVVLRAASL
ncbi:MAG TPA: class I SAM-dependent methyltransferase [Solirubrobacterales bacterium]|nr:class I SAM-dependent methyltransferase [Solirubrobacterales bacterium]